MAASLAEGKKGRQLMELFGNIKGTIDDDDLDQVSVARKFRVMNEVRKI